MLFFLILLILPGQVAGHGLYRNEEAPSVISLDRVQEGMTGIGKTVVRGQEVETFDVEVLSLIDNQRPVDKLILIRVSGELIDETGGIASGMSGSPIYIDDQLMGAIGYGWQLTDHRLGLVTPIEMMLDLWEEDEVSSNEIIELEEELKIEGRYIRGLEFLKDGDQPEKGDDYLQARPASTPVLVGGLGDRGLEQLEGLFQQHNLKPVQGGSLREMESLFELEPGSAIAIQLARGDINVSAIGTLTYLDKNRVLGFGHPFMLRGNSNYLLSGAYIHHLVDSLDMPFKIGSPTNLLGLVDVDRQAGVSGWLNRYPLIVPLRSWVTDLDRETKERSNVQIARDDDFLTSLALASALESVDRAIDRIGKGTANVRLELTGHGLPEKKLVRDNIFYSSVDIASAAIRELGGVLDLLIFNPFRDVELIDIKLDIEVTEEIEMATIKELTVLNEEVAPGDQLEIRVVIQPYRQQEEEIVVAIDLPEDISHGMATISVFGGEHAAYYGSDYNDQDQMENDGHAITSDFKSLEEIVEAFLQLPQNNELMVEIWPQYQGPPIREEEEAPSPEEREEDEEDYHLEDDNERELTEIATTDYYLTGRLSTTIDILPPEIEKEDEEEIDVEEEEVANDQE